MTCLAAFVTLVTALIAAVLTQPVAAGMTFRMEVRPLLFGRMDPIVSPGSIAGHMHSILGGSRFRDYLDSTSNMKMASCTTARVKADKSNYWTPTLYYIWPNGTFSAVITNTIIYYQSQGMQNLNPYPEGFRMIAGLATRRDVGSQATVGVRLEFDNGPTNLGNRFFMNNTAPTSMRTRIFFPNCGLANQALDSPDHFSHMAYALHGNDWAVNGNRCPDTHPVVYPQIMIETFYRFTPEMLAKWRPGQANLAWANGDTAGDTFHADFTNGWDTAAMQRAIDRQCTGMTNVEIDCFDEPAWDPAAMCRYEGEVPSEDAGFIKPLTKLPGCNPLWGWGVNNKPTCTSPNPGYVGPNLLYWSGYLQFPVVLPGTDTTNAGSWLGGNGQTGPKLVEWPGPKKGTQAQVDAAVVQNAGNAHPKVVGLDNVPPFTATTPTTTVNLAGKTADVATYHRTLTYQCPSQVGGAPCGPTGAAARRHLRWER